MIKTKKEEESIEEKEDKNEASENELKDEVKKPSRKTSRTKKEVKKEVKKEEVSIKKESDSNLPLRTLIDLVNESGIRRKEIIVILADNGYLGQFYEEEEKRRIGYPIKPTINENDFKKIIGE